MFVYSIILALLSVCAWADGCDQAVLKSTLDGAPVSQSLQTGSIRFEFSGERYQQFNITIRDAISNKTQNPDISVSISYIQSFIANGLIDFSVNYFDNNTSPTFFTIVFMIDNSSEWNSVLLHYFVSSLEQIRVGEFEVTDNSLLNPTDKDITVKHPVEWTLPLDSMKVILFLSGLKSFDLNLNVHILEELSILTEEKEISATIKTENQKTPIEFLKFSYLVYTNQEPIVGVSPMFQSSITQMSKSITSSNASYTLQDQNFFLGMTDFSGTDFTQLIEVNRRTLSTFTSEEQLTVFNKAFSIEGYKFSNAKDAIGVLTGNTSSVDCVTTKQCALRNGVRFFDPQEEKVFCFLCPVNQTYNSQKDSCQCRSGWLRNFEGKCIAQIQLCKLGQFFSDGLCYKITVVSSQNLCGKNQQYNTTTKTCQCIENYVQVVDDRTIVCQQPCDGITQLLNPQTNQCQCYVGQINSQGVCQECDPNTEQWDQKKKQCNCISPSKRVDGVCVLCARNSNYDEENQKCICKEGYFGNGLFCRPIR